MSNVPLWRAVFKDAVGKVLFEASGNEPLTASDAEAEDLLFQEALIRMAMKDREPCVGLHCEPPLMDRWKTATLESSDLGQKKLKLTREQIPDETIDNIEEAACNRLDLQ
jgi:hypothetical protein